MKNIIVGINYGSGHDSAAVILVDGKMVAMGEEERFTRIKHDNAFPHRSIQFCLREAGIIPEDVNYVAIGWHKWAHMPRRALFLSAKFPNQSVTRKLKFLRSLYIAADTGHRLAAQSFPNAKIIPVEHHIAHAASCYLTSEFDESAIITWDGRGEWTTTLLAHAQGNQFRKIKEAYYPYSLGMVYNAFTHYLGFGPYDEYKVMGLSAYGEPTYKDQINKIVAHSNDTLFNVDLRYIQHPGFCDTVRWGEPRYYSDLLVKAFGPARKTKDPIEQKHMDIAKSLQVCFNEIGTAVADHLFEQTQSPNLCLAGGVALNGVMNNEIAKNTPFKHIHFTSAANDAGVALGAALYLHNTLTPNTSRISINHAYWGSRFSDIQIKKEVDGYGYHNVVKLSDPAQTAAKLIAEGNIIGWFQGSAEFGPRALGSRSILADPRPAENKDIVNARIKFREEFRPFAPSVLSEYASEYFDITMESPYMLLICNVLPDKRKEIQAVTHVNHTARPQTVSKDVHPLYYNLIHHFYKLTNCPLVLNTSFNVKGEPIVDSPSDAIRCFYSTGLDYLIIGSYLLHKQFIPITV